MEPVATHLRVRYAETDQMSVVYYANYLRFLERARTIARGAADGFLVGVVDWKPLAGDSN